MMGRWAYFSMFSLSYSIAGLAVTSKGILCSLTACLRNMLIAWVVLTPRVREELRRVVPRLPLHAYGDVDRLHADLPALCVRYAAIVRAAGGLFPESVMA